jgi:hypothetical protein
MMKKAIITALATVLATATVSAGNVNYRAMVERKGIGRVREYYSNELTADILETRGDDIVIEKIIGVCENRKGDGRILNSADTDYDYISYRSVKGVKPGDVVLTICIYEPGNGYTDDVADRFDYVIDEAG